MTAAEWGECLARIMEGWPLPAWTRERMGNYTTLLEALDERDVSRAIRTCIDRVAKLADATVGRFPPQPAELASLAAVYRAERLHHERMDQRSIAWRDERRALSAGERVVVPRWVIRAGVARLRGGRTGMFDADPWAWPTGWCSYHEGPAWCALPDGHGGDHDPQT